MAFVTYILLSTLLYGLAGKFNPEQLGLTASFAFTIVILEIITIKIGCYLLSINNESQLLDLVAYSGYKFVGIIVTLAVTTLGLKWLEYLVFGYTFNANAFFLVCPSNRRPRLERKKSTNCLSIVIHSFEA